MTRAKLAILLIGFILKQGNSPIAANFSDVVFKGIVQLVSSVKYSAVFKNMRVLPSGSNHESSPAFN